MRFTKFFGIFFRHCGDVSTSLGVFFGDVFVFGCICIVDTYVGVFSNMEPKIADSLSIRLYLLFSILIQEEETKLYKNNHKKL